MYAKIKIKSNIVSSKTIEYKNSLAKLMEYECLQETSSNTHIIDNPLGEKTKNTKLVIRINKELSCRQCFDTMLVYIDIAKKIIDSKNIIISSDFNNDRDFNVELKTKKHEDVEAFNCPVGTFKIPADTIISMYFFIMDDDNIIKSVFIPQNNLLVRTKKYFMMIQKKYFNGVDQFYNEVDGTVFFFNR
jgi:hypothetical protein